MSERWLTYQPMKETENHKAGQPSGVRQPEPAVRPTIKLFVGIACLLCAGVVAIHFLWSGTKPESKSSQPDVASQTQAATAAKGSPKAKWFGPGAGTTASRQAPAASAYHVEPLPEVSQLVNSLVYYDKTGGPLNATEAAAWRETLKRLIAQGDTAVPAISEFLANNRDFKFEGEDAKLLGYPSARMAMIDALMQIVQGGSATAITALDTVLQRTEGPQEIATVTQFLEKNQPGVFLQDAFLAAQRVLASSANGQLPGVDVAPLFQVLQQYESGDAYTIPVLRDSASQWNYYAAIALARLPDEAGVPALIQIATGQDGSGSSARAAALQALSGMISQSADARQTLLSLSANNNLSAYDWTSLAPYLAGNQMVFQNTSLGNPLSAVNPNDVRSTYLPASNQKYFSAPLTAANSGQIEFIDKLLAVTTDPTGIQVLQSAKSALENRIGLAANSPGQ